MDIATIVGFIAAATSLMVGIGSNLRFFLDPPSLIIVVGGTIAAILVSFPLPDVVNGPIRGLNHAVIPPKPVIDRMLGKNEETSPEELKKLERELRLGIAMFGRMKTYAQATGWIGVLIGLVIMLKHGAFTDLTRLGPGMAICILTALYGTIIGFLICLPIQTKLEQHLSRLQEF